MDERKKPWTHSNILLPILIRIAVLRFAAAMTVTKLASDVFALPDDTLKLSGLAKPIVSRYPNTGVDRVLEGSRRSVDAQLMDPVDSFVLKGGEEMAIIPRVSGG